MDGFDRGCCNGNGQGCESRLFIENFLIKVFLFKFEYISKIRVRVGVDYTDTVFQRYR